MGRHNATFMKERSWTDGGATVPTIVGTLISLLAAPMGGLGALAGLFGASVPAVMFLLAALLLWFSGRWLIDR